MNQTIQKLRLNWCHNLCPVRENQSQEMRKRYMVDTRMGSWTGMPLRVNFDPEAKYLLDSQLVHVLEATKY